MRILIIHNYYQDRGGEDTVFEQEVALLSQKHDVQTITFKNKKGLNGVYQFLSYPYNLLAGKKVSRIIKQFKPDVAHVHNIHYSIGPIAFRTLKNNKIPTVYTLHNYRLLDPSASLFFNDQVYMDTIHKDFPWKSVRLKVLNNSFLKTLITAFTYWLHKKLNTWKNIDTYLVFSNFMKDIILSSAIGIKENQIRIKPNFVAHTEVQSSSKRKNHFIFVGRLDTQKGVKILLEAFANTEFVLDIYGTGPLAYLVEEYSSNHPNIHFHGHQNKEVINRALLGCDAMIITSISYEGMPMTVIEAMSMGTPVIASDIGILSEMIVNNYNGYKFKTKDAVNLRQTLSIWQGISDEQKALISQNCKQEFKNKYTASKNIELLESIYADTIEKSST